MLQRNLWLALGAAVGVVAWGLTRWITHVNYAPEPIVSVTFDERPALAFKRIPVDYAAWQRERHLIPEAALTGTAQVLFFVTPATRSITFSGVNPQNISCGAFPRPANDEAALVAGAEPATPLAMVEIEARNPKEAFMPIPAWLRRALVETATSRGAIRCTFRRPLASVPTFVERAITIRALTGEGGAVILNVSALENIDDLRFAGGLQAPLGGDRTRVLYAGNDVVSAEWVDVAAQGQRDIVLVLIGALSAIAAATIIEGIRPAVESRSKR